MLGFSPLGASPLAGENEPIAPVASPSRGDDPFRSSGARAAFWRAQAEQWAEDRLEAVKEAANSPVQARKRVTRVVEAEAPAKLIEWPEFAPQIDMIEALSQRLLAPSVDYTEIALAVAMQLEMLEARRRAARRKRDAEALLLLVA